MANSDNGALHKDSLMSEINSLFAPPTAESYGKKGLGGIPSARRIRKGNDSSSTDNFVMTGDQVLPGLSNLTSSYSTHSNGRDDPFWRKPRANCHEFCDSCGCIEGERLVCDRCPSSFHLECLDPPLEPDEAPIGVWFCHKCSMALKDEEDQASTSSSQNTAVTETGSVRSSRPTSRSSTKKADFIQSLNLLAGAALTQAQQQQPSRRSACISRALTNERALTGRSSRSAAWGESAYVADTEESELRALWGVIKYAQYQNPKEFDLPKDLLPGIKLPGSYKTLNERKAKSIIDLENGIIPRPVRRCFVCSRTCLLAPLLPCDYCSSCFHLECLDPPLPHFPPRSDRWMCPNHVEHIADRYLVRSIRLTERLRIWSQLAKVPKSSDSSNLSFPGSGTSLKVKKETMDRLEEDGADVTGYEKVIPHEEPVEVEGNLTPPLEPVPPYELFYGPDEEAAILADLMKKVQRGRAEEASVLSCVLGTTETLAGEMKEPVCGMPARRLWRFNRVAAVHPRILLSEAGSTRVVVPPAVKAMYARGVKRIPRPSESVPDVEVPISSSNGNDSTLFVRGLLEFYLKSTASQGSEQNFTDDTTKSAAEVDHTPTLADPIPLDTVASKSYHELEKCLKKLKEVGTSLESLSADDRALVDIPLILSLAEQRIRQIYGTHGDDSLRPFGSPTTLPDVEPCKLRTRAVFTPCGGTTGPAVGMHFRKLTIGTSPDCHLQLNNYRLTGPAKLCRFRSPHHATVFFDEWTRHFELLNYSEYGSRVDGVIYGNQVESRWSEMIKPSDVTGRVRQFEQNIESTHPSLVARNNAKRPRMHAPRREGYACEHSDCTSWEVDSAEIVSEGKQDETFIPGWEGSAIVRHGSLLQFGCYQFVMSLVDDCPNNLVKRAMEATVLT